MKKKMLSAMLVLSMMTGMLTGCGSKGSSEVGSTEGVSAGDVDVYNMVMEIVNYGYDDPDLQMVEDAVNEIAEEEIGVHVTFLTVPISEMATKIGLLVAGNEQIDLVQTGFLCTPQGLASQGLLTPMDEYLTDDLKVNAGKLLNACTYQGEVYAYPGNYYCGQQVRYFYDQDLAEEYNIEVPEILATEDDWNDLFKQIKASGMTQYGISLGDGVAAEDTWGINFDTLGERTTISYGCVMDIENGSKVESWFDTDEYAQLCDMHRSWYENGYAVPDSISNGYTTMDSMQQGTIFGFVSGSSLGCEDAYFTGYTGKNIASVPVGTEQRVIATAQVVNNSWGISSTCENPQKVCEFLDLMYTNADVANLMNYGIEGTHYVTTEGSKVINYPDGVDPSSCGYGSFVGTFGDLSLTYFRSPITDEEIDNIAEYGTENAVISKFMGYSFDNSSVQAEVTAVQAVVGQYASALACGTVDPSTIIPEFQAALKSAGFDKIIEENQTQLNAWLESK